ncbi:hypothetical protein CspHIS471_0505310 [Cutaneotrichosporon sp. HIS471]|nr:hypothetical protein CspHIS471_0505310 [Cutaneotrichosporon sp. HIS471]
MSEGPGYPDGHYPQQQSGAPQGFIGQTWSSLMPAQALNGGSQSFGGQHSQTVQPQYNGSAGHGNSTPAGEHTYSYASNSTTVSYPQIGQRAEPRSAAQFAQYQAQPLGRITAPLGSSPSTSHHAQNERSLPPITAIPEYNNALRDQSTYVQQDAYSSYPQAESSGSSTQQHPQAYPSHGYTSQGHPPGNQSYQSLAHQPQAQGHLTHRHSQGQPMLDQSQGLYSDSQTQSTYPPTGPATFPSPVQNAATVPDPSATPSSSRPILRSPTSQTRTSLHGRRDSVQQSFSQLRMFAQKFETTRGSVQEGNRAHSQQFGGSHSLGHSRRPSLPFEDGAQPQQSPQSRPEQPRPSAIPQVSTTAASPPLPWAQQPQVTTASSAGIPQAHRVQPLWSRQLLPPSGTAPTAQLQAPQGAVSPQALSTVPRPSEESGPAVPQRPPQASALGHAPRQASQASPPPPPVGQCSAQYAAPTSQRPETQVAPMAVRTAQVDAVSALSAGPARQSAARPPAAWPSTPAPGPAAVTKLPAPHAQAARPPAAAQIAAGPPRPIQTAPRPVVSLADQKTPATPAAPGHASPGHASAPTTPRSPNGTRLVPISASQVSTPRKVVNISSGHSEGYVRREEMAGAGPVYVIAKESERVWNSQPSQSSQAPQAAQVRTPETQASAATVAPSAMRVGAGNDAPHQARPWPSHPTVTTHPAARPVPEAGPSQPGLSSQPAPSTAPAPTATAAQAPTATAAQAPTGTAALSSPQPAAAATPTPASQPRKVGRPLGTGKLQIAAAREREAAVRAAMLSEGIDPDLCPATLAAALHAAASATAPKSRARKSATPMAVAPLAATPTVRERVVRPPAPTSTPGPPQPVVRPQLGTTLNDYVQMLPQSTSTRPHPSATPGQAVRPGTGPSNQPAMSHPVQPAIVTNQPARQNGFGQPARAPPSQVEVVRAIAAHQARAIAAQRAKASSSGPVSISTSQRASPSQLQKTSARNSPRPLEPKNLAVVGLANPMGSAAPAPTSASSATPGPSGISGVVLSVGRAGTPQTGTSVGTSNGASKTPAAPPSALDAPDPQAAAHAQRKRIGPINRAMVVVPISRTRREQLIARGVYDPFRDDADPYLEPERVGRRPRAAQTYPMTKIISVSISRGTAQRIREPEAIKDRFAHPPEPPMREPFKSVLARDSLLNRLGNYVCEWKGCGGEMASETKLLRHVQARDHAGQAAFTFGNLELYKCYWGNCDSASFRTAGKLEQHMLAMHVCEKPVCPYEDCDLRSSTISHLHRHVVRNHEDGDQPRPRVDCPSEAALSPPEALPASMATVELTILPALGKSHRTERYQELAHAKVLKMCVAPENPEIHVVHPPHMLEVIGNEDENMAESREASSQGGKRGDTEEETEEEREKPSEEILLQVEAAIVQEPLQRKRRDASLPGPEGGNKRAMARRTGGDPVTPRSSQRVAAQRKVKAEPVRFTRRQTARRTGRVASPISVSDGSSPPSNDNGKGRTGAPPLADSKPVEWGRSGRGQRMIIDCIEVPRIDTSGYKRMDK